MFFHQKLPIPKEVKERYPLKEGVIQKKASRDMEIRKVFTGESDKFLVIIGPCSADKTDMAL